MSEVNSFSAVKDNQSELMKLDTNIGFQLSTGVHLFFQ